MQVEGVTGGAEEAGHTAWMLLRSFDWGLGRRVGSPKSKAKDREGAEAFVNEITVSKEQDGSSAGLLRLALWGKAKKATVEFVRTGSNDRAFTYMKFDLENVLFSKYSVASGGDRPTESLALNFTKVTYRNDDSDVKNEGGPPDRFEYDLATGKGG
jgi:type VI secretion system secreted protein Hcp